MDGTFEVVVGQVRGGDDPPTRFAFLRQGSADGAAMIAQALREHGVSPDRVSPFCPMAMRVCGDSTRCYLQGHSALSRTSSGRSSTKASMERRRLMPAGVPVIFCATSGPRFSSFYVRRTGSIGSTCSNDGYAAA